MVSVTDKGCSRPHIIEIKNVPLPITTVVFLSSVNLMSDEMIEEYLSFAIPAHAFMPKHAISVVS